MILTRPSNVNSLNPACPIYMSSPIIVLFDGLLAPEAVWSCVSWALLEAEGAFRLYRKRVVGVTLGLFCCLKSTKKVF